jgi:enoyl-[acyl-carrier protein] reductase I
MSFLDIESKYFYIAGVANKKSVATFTAKTLIDNGSKCIFSAQNEKNLASIRKIFPDSPCFLLDVENSNHLSQLRDNILKHTDKLHGLLHSMAFANFSEGPKAFHQTTKEDYLQACHISSFSLVQMANELKDILTSDASVVTVSISSTKATSYGYLGPIKAMLEATIPYLAKSFSEFSQIRFNSVGAGPLKTSASAGIPNYIENYLYAEQLTLRKKSLQTNEVANAITYLLSPVSSGVNASNLIIDAGMGSNYFDQDIVTGFAKQKL